MKTTTKRRLKVYLPILVAVILTAVVIAIILLNNKVTAKDYFDSLNNSNYSKQVQNTTIYDGNLLIYEKIETIIFDGENVYHKIEEKQQSADINKDYDQTLTEFYYSKDKIYYFEDNVWKSQDFTVSKNLKNYFLKTDYFETLTFNKKVENEGRLSGKVKDNSINKIVNSSEMTNMNLLIVVNSDFDVQKFEITAKTSSNRDVKIINTYTYLDETVFLPAS